MSYTRNPDTSSPSTDKIDPYLIEENQLTISEDMIASGTYGKIFIGFLDKVKPVAIKKMEYTKEAQYENDILCKLTEEKAPNVIKYYGYQVSPSWAIIMEDGGYSLSQYINHYKSSISLTLRCEIMGEISKAIEFLHDVMHYVHRDIKCENVLINPDNMQIKLCDFGYAVEIKEKEKLMEFRGTPAWTAPEIFCGAPYNEKADIYSLGMVVWEITALNIPYSNINNLNKLVMHVITGKREVIPADCRPELKQLITECWEENVKSRPTAKNVHDRLLTLNQQLKIEESLAAESQISSEKQDGTEPRELSLGDKNTSGGEITNPILSSQKFKKRSSALLFPEPKQLTEDISPDLSQGNTFTNNQFSNH